MGSGWHHAQARGTAGGLAPTRALSPNIWAIFSLWDSSPCSVHAEGGGRGRQGHPVLMCAWETSGVRFLHLCCGMGQKGPRWCPRPITQPYQEALAVFVESDLLQPRLHLAGLPVGHRGQDAPRNLLPYHAQHLFGQGGGGAAGGVAHHPLQALRGSDLAENLGTQREGASLCFPNPMLGELKGAQTTWGCSSSAFPFWHLLPRGRPPLLPWFASAWF